MDINYFRVGKVQYVYSPNDKEGYAYCCMKYDNNKVIDTGRGICENTFPVTPEEDIKFFISKEELYKFLDKEATNNLDHVMWPLTPEKWIKPCEMQEPIGYK